MMIGETSPAPGTRVLCAECKGSIPPKDGRYHIGDRSYHVVCYERARVSARLLGSGSPQRAQLVVRHRAGATDLEPDGRVARDQAVAAGEDP
jgi:hypothetical protein